MGRFRKGIIIGFSAGYVYGAKAGRERYEQISKAWRRVKSTGMYQGASAKVGAAVGLSIERGKVVAMEGIHKATGMAVRRRRDGLKKDSTNWS